MSTIFHVSRSTYTQYLGNGSLHFSGIFQTKTPGSGEQRLGPPRERDRREQHRLWLPPPNSTDQGWVPRRSLSMPGPRLSGSGEQLVCPADLTEFGWRECPHTPSVLGQSLPLISQRIPANGSGSPGPAVDVDFRGKQPVYTHSPGSSRHVDPSY